jgi:signal transduction histidine kinase
VRLGEFIQQNIEPILQEWEVFARRLDPTGTMNPEELRDHARVMLESFARDMAAGQTGARQASKSKGDEDHADESRGVSRYSLEHATDRVDSGFKLLDVIAEYRALRASVLRLWRESRPGPNDRDLEDLTRFNEAIDQSLAIAARGFTEKVARSREMFLAVLWHDLRNPLNAIRMGSSILDEQGELNEQDRRMVVQIRRSAEAMNRLISDLIDLSTGEIRGGLPLHPALTDLADLSRQVAEETRAGAPDRPVHLRTSGDLRGRWDPGRLRQALSNLLGNAVQHGAGPIEVWAADAGPEVELGVRNAGPPIPRERLPTIFDPLSGRSASGGRRAGSLGLGLHIVHQIVTGHSGTIDIESSDRAGTVVTVRLPRDGADGG